MPDSRSINTCWRLAILVIVLVAGVAPMLLAQQPAASDPQGVPAEAAPASQTVLSMVTNGGVLMIPIAICSFILLMFVFERAINLRGGAGDPAAFRKELPRPAALW